MNGDIKWDLLQHDLLPHIWLHTALNAWKATDGTNRQRKSRITIWQGKKKKFMSNTYLHIFPKLLQEHFLVLFVNVDLLPIVDEVIVLVRGQLFSLPISIGD